MRKGEKEIAMKSKFGKISVLFLLCTFVFAFGATAYAKNSEKLPSEGRVYKPVILTSITSKTTKVKVYTYADTTLKITTNKSKKALVKKSYVKEGIKVVSIPKQKKGTKLFFSLENNKSGKAAQVVRKTVGKTDKNLAKVKLSANFKDGMIQVKGTVGSTVYIKQTGKGQTGKWSKAAVILDRGGVEIHPRVSTVKTTSYAVRLKSVNGKYTATKTVKIPPQKVDVAAN